MRIIFIILKHKYVAHICICYVRKHYLHLRARGGGVEDSKSIDSASEPCNIKIMIKMKQYIYKYFLYKY